MRLSGKVAMITGGGSGLGLATANLFAKEGARVSVVDMDEPAAQRAAEGIRQAGGQACFVKADVTRSADVQRAVAVTVSTLGGLHILFNNAGIGGGPLSGSVETTPEDEWDRVIAVNLKGVFLCSKYGIPEIKRSGGGAIVNTASIAGIVSLPTHAYCASKAGVIELTKSMAIELAKKGIRVNAVAPGYIDTPLLRGIRHGAGAEQGERTIAYYTAKTPMGRIGRPEDIASAVLYLASDEASLVTGHTLVVDGGYTVM